MWGLRLLWQCLKITVFWDVFLYSLIECEVVIWQCLKITVFWGLFLYSLIECEVWGYYGSVWRSLSSGMCFCIISYNVRFEVVTVVLLRIQYFGMWHCITEWVLMFQRIIAASSSSVKHFYLQGLSSPVLTGVLNPWRWKCHDPLKCQEPLAPWHSITSLKAWILILVQITM